MVYQIEAGCVRLLWVGKERTAESFEKFGSSRNRVGEFEAF